MARAPLPVKVLAETDAGLDRAPGTRTTRSALGAIWTMLAAAFAPDRRALTLGTCCVCAGAALVLAGSVFNATTYVGTELLLQHMSQAQLSA